jgi:hypothetical protein
MSKGGIEVRTLDTSCGASRYNSFDKLGSEPRTQVSIDTPAPPAEGLLTPAFFVINFSAEFARQVRTSRLVYTQPQNLNRVDSIKTEMLHQCH